MEPEDVKLNAVNWQYEMEVTPDHFVRQERYFDSALLWTLRYATVGFGLVGGGPRLPAGERGAVRHDPIVVIHDGEEELSIAVTQCRGLTPGGCMIDVDSDHAVHRAFPKDQFRGVAEATVYVVCRPHQKEECQGPPDEYNPEMKTERRLAYELSLQPAPEAAAYSMAVGRIRRPLSSPRFERDFQFIPPCLSMASYSELAAAGRKILNETHALMERYVELNRAMREYLVLFEERGIETENDVQALGFVERMVVALQNCVYGILDPGQSPSHFFAETRKLFHCAATYLDLSPPVQQYFDLFLQAGETEFVSLIQRQKKLLGISPRWEVNDDMAQDVREATDGLAELRRLEQALEGKYIDFRVSTILESVNFIFDRGGKVLYKFSKRPVSTELHGSFLIIRFAQLGLQGSNSYRLILVGASPFAEKARISVGIRMNQATGYSDPVHEHEAEGSDWKDCKAVMEGQRNFEIDFEAPDVPMLSDVRVSIAAQHPIKTALIFTRHRFYSGHHDVPRAVSSEPPSGPRPRFQDGETTAPLPSESRQHDPVPPTPPRRNRLG